jgi:hypothetical protein
LNASWLMMGEGTMYEQMGRKVPGNLFDTPEMQPEVPDPVENPEGDPESSQILDSKRPSEPAQVEPIAPESTTKAETTEATTQSEERPAEESREARKIVQLLVIYDDDTFRTFAPAH